MQAVTTAARPHTTAIALMKRLLGAGTASAEIFVAVSIFVS
jgi:hypothetical protein